MFWEKNLKVINFKIINFFEVSLFIFLFKLLIEFCVFVSLSFGGLGGWLELVIWFDCVVGGFCFFLKFL